MTEVTRILAAIEQGDPLAALKLLPRVYRELRRLAARKLVQEKPEQSLQATGLVREAYLRFPLCGTGLMRAAGCTRRSAQARHRRAFDFSVAPQRPKTRNDSRTGIQEPKSWTEPNSS
jgi:hypothetical protein